MGPTEAESDSVTPLTASTSSGRRRLGGRRAASVLGGLEEDAIVWGETPVPPPPPPPPPAAAAALVVVPKMLGPVGVLADARGWLHTSSAGMLEDSWAEVLRWSSRLGEGWHGTTCVRRRSLLSIPTPAAYDVAWKELGVLSALSGRPPWSSGRVSVALGEAPPTEEASVLSSPSSLLPPRCTKLEILLASSPMRWMPVRSCEEGREGKGRWPHA